MILRAASRELLFAQLTAVVSLIVGPISTAVIVSLFSPENQGQYYLLAALATVIGILHLGDLEAAIAAIDKRSPEGFSKALSGLCFWRLVTALVFSTLALYVANFTDLIGATSGQAATGVAYLLLVAANAVVAAPHQLSQAILAPYWRRRFYEFFIYSATLVLSLYVMRDTGALVIAATASLLANLWFSNRVRSARCWFHLRTGSVDFWRAHILPRQTSLGLAHIYSQMGFRLLVPVGSEAFGVVFAGQLGATLSVLGFGLGVFQLRLRVLFPSLTDMQRDTSAAQRNTLERLERVTTAQMIIGLLTVGIVMAALLLILPPQFEWISYRFLSAPEIIAVSGVLAGIGIVGVKVVFRLTQPKSASNNKFVLMVLIALAVGLPLLCASVLGRSGFWAGAIAGPLFLLLALSRSRP